MASQLIEVFRYHQWVIVLYPQNKLGYAFIALQTVGNEGDITIEGVNCLPDAV